MKLTKEFYRGTTTGDMAKLINTWEMDRGAEAEEYIFNVDDEEDFKCLVNLYLPAGAVACFNIHRGYWWGGNAFKYDDDAMLNMMHKGEDYYLFTNEVILRPFFGMDRDLEWILGEVEDSIDTYVKEGWSADEIAKCYGNLIDVEGYLKSDKANAVKAFYANNTEFDIEDIEKCVKVDEDFDWELWNVDLGCGNDAVLYNKNEDYYLSVGDDGYPLKISEIKLYRWCNIGKAFFVLDAHNTPKEYDKITYERLVKLNGGLIGNEIIDGVAEYDNSKRHSHSLLFENAFTHNTFKAYYKDANSIEPYRITKSMSFKLR